LATILRGHEADGAIIMEPTDFAICPAQAGALNFRITVRGRSAHGCIRDEGISALELFLPVHEELLALEARRNHTCSDPLFQGVRLPFPLSVGKIEGGDWPSSVPDWVQVEGRYGLAPEEDVSQAQAAFQGAVDRVVDRDPWFRENPPEVEWWGGRFLPARIPLDDPLVKDLQRAYLEASGTEARMAGVTFGSDMRHLVREAGIPAVLFGPGDIRRAHAANESIGIEDLERTARVLILMSLRFCGCDDD
jgi:acetylornithine deacetylase